MEKFYELVDKTIKENREYYNIVMGDWNSKIGKGEEIKGTMGPNGLGKRNQRGKKLIEFAIRNNLKIAASFYKKRPNRK